VILDCSVNRGPGRENEVCGSGRIIAATESLEADPEIAHSFGRYAVLFKSSSHPIGGVRSF
jgi:hypothetical protein